MTRTTVLGAALCVVAGAVVGWCSKAPAAPAGPAMVRTDTLYMEAERVPLTPSFGGKLITAPAKPTQTRIADTPSAAGTKAVASYCSPSIVFADRGKISLRTEAEVKDSAPQFHSRLPDLGGRRDGPRLNLYSTLNDGRRWAADYHVRGRISWASDGDSVLVRGDRLWVRVLRGAPRCGAIAAASGGLGAVIDRDHPGRGFLLGSLSTIAGCLR